MTEPVIDDAMVERLALFFWDIGGLPADSAVRVSLTKHAKNALISALTQPPPSPFAPARAYEFSSPDFAIAAGYHCHRRKDDPK